MDLNEDTPPPPRRLWLIFFSSADPLSWWSRLMPAGFGHVCAAAWFADAERWVHVNPTWRGLVVEVMTADEFGSRFQQLVTRSAVVLRMASSHHRNGMPATFYCVGAIKALLGVQSRALLPRGLYRDLRRKGAEVVDGIAVQAGHSSGGP
jgi:hypothetical protein